MPAGRPSKYDDIDLGLVERLCKLGLTDEELALALDINVDTVYDWKNKHPEFSEAIKKGKVEADANVADSLYNRAIGYEHEDVHFSSYEGMVTATPYTKYYPPDPTAAIFWLKNRQPRVWRDKQEINQNISINRTAKDLSDDELAAIAAGK